MGLKLMISLFRELHAQDIHRLLGEFYAQITRFDDCALLDVLRLLRVRVELQQRRLWPDRDLTVGYVTFLAPEFVRFWIKTDQTERMRRSAIWE